MTDIYAIPITVAVGAIAWVYQSALSRQDRRISQYFAVLESLTGFLVGAQNAGEKRERAVTCARVLWLIASPDIVRAGNAFFDAAQGADINASSAALTNFVLKMRDDTTLKSVLLPRRLWQLSASDIKLYRGS